MHPDEAFASVTEKQFGCASREQARRCKLSPQQIRYRLERGRWVEVHRAVYRIAGTVPSFRGAVMAAHLAAGVGTAAASTTAARLWRLPGFDSAPANELITAEDRRVRAAGLSVIRPRTLKRRDVTRLGPIPITAPVRALIDLAGTTDGNVLEAALDDALSRGLIDLASLERRIDGLIAPGMRSLRALVDDRRADAAAESALELKFARILNNGGLPKAVRQFVVRDPSGAFVARVDFAYADERIAIEIDGYAFHSGRARFHQGHERDHQLFELGWLTMHFTANHTNDPSGVVRRITRVLKERRGWSLRAD